MKQPDHIGSLFGRDPHTYVKVENRLIRDDGVTFELVPIRPKDRAWALRIIEELRDEEPT